VDNIKIDMNETGCEDVDRINVAQDRVQWQLHFCHPRKTKGVIEVYVTIQGGIRI
jgi:hypothetical protein